MDNFPPPQNLKRKCVVYDMGVREQPDFGLTPAAGLRMHVRTVTARTRGALGQQRGNVASKQARLVYPFVLATAGARHRKVMRLRARARVQAFRECVH